MPTSRSRKHVDIFNEAEGKLLPLLARFTEGTDHASTETGDLCVRLGLIPGALQEAWEMMRFVSRTVLAAQKAQRRYSIPASVLMSIALGESGWDATELVGARTLSFDSSECAAASIDAWFMAKARGLALTSPLREAMPLVNDVEAYVRRLCDLGFGSQLDADDVLYRIEKFELRDCDIAPILPAGQFDGQLYKAERNSSGRVELRPAIDMRDIAAMLIALESAPAAQNAGFPDHVR